MVFFKKEKSVVFIGTKNEILNIYKDYLLNRLINYLVFNHISIMQNLNVVGFVWNYAAGRLYVNLL